MDKALICSKWLCPHFFYNNSKIIWGVLSIDKTSIHGQSPILF
jgi:hypothetical protein